jgi:hypothetical protein
MKWKVPRAAATSAFRGAEAGLSPRDKHKTLLASEAFELELARARADAERTGKPFVLLTSSVSPSGDANGHLVAHAARVICRRSRLSDVAGWYGDDGRIGLILCGTGERQARHVVHALEAAFCEGIGVAANTVRLVCEVQLHGMPMDGEAAGSGQ